MALMGSTFPEIFEVVMSLPEINGLAVGGISTYTCRIKHQTDPLSVSVLG